MKQSPANHEGSASQAIDARIAALDDWRGETLARVRRIIHAADPDVVEEVKWRGTPVWSHGGIICTGETYKAAVKLTFARGAALADPKRLFNSSLEGNVRRAIDIHAGERIDERALTSLVRAAVALNLAKARKNTAKKPAAKQPAAKQPVAKKPVATKPAVAKAGKRPTRSA